MTDNPGMEDLYAAQRLADLVHQLARHIGIESDRGNKEGVYGLVSMLAVLTQELHSVAEEAQQALTTDMIEVHAGPPPVTNGGAAP